MNLDNYIFKNTKSKINKLRNRGLISAQLSTLIAWLLLLFLHVFPFTVVRIDRIPFWIMLSAITRDVFINGSIAILIANAFLSKKDNKGIFWYLLNIPLFLAFPIVLLQFVMSIINLYSHFFYPK